jgi:hypothetical protein
MAQAAQELSIHIDSCIEDRINHFIDPSERLLTETYRMAYQTSILSTVGGPAASKTHKGNTSDKTKPRLKREY